MGGSCYEYPAAEVPTYSIRTRILKDLPQRLDDHADIVPTYSIRTRILKANNDALSHLSFLCSNLFDPNEDTERLPSSPYTSRRSAVPTYSIRTRILKAGGSRGRTWRRFLGSNLFDPNEDTERYSTTAPPNTNRILFQPIRSERGY